jgi:tetratricopeptide (TPR) repeat protein
MPRRRSVLLTQTSRRELRLKCFFWLCAISLFVAGLSGFPSSSESARQRTAKNPGPSQKQKSPGPKKPASEQGSTTRRGIINDEVPDFKAETPASALVIGISSYPNLPANAQLRYAHTDAQAVRDFLVSEKGGFRVEDVTLLLNEQATQDQIMREIGHLHERTGNTGLALIFFAGHGVVKSNQAYLIASDTKADDLFATGIDMKYLNSSVQSMRARSVVIITDACHSGALGDSLRTGPVDNVSAKYFDQPSQRIDQSSFIFSAASPTQASIEDSDLKRGLFTHLTLQGLDGAADADGNGVVTSAELYNFVLATMKTEARKRNVAQVPEHNPNYDRSIPLAIVNEPGRSKYKEWFTQDARFATLLAAFTEALDENRLTRPEDQSAWDYLTALKHNPGTPPGIAKEKEDLFLKKVVSEADKVINESPLDSTRWDEAAANLQKAHELKRDRALAAKQYFCELKSLVVKGDLAAAERKCDMTLELIEREGSADHSITIKIGQFYSDRKRWEQARRAYSLANNKTPSEITEYAEVLVNLNHYVDAEAQLRHALKNNGDYRPALIRLSALLLRDATKERVAEALVHSSHALKLAPDDLDAEEVFGRAHLAMNDTQRAIDSLVKVARLRPRGEIRNRALRYLSESYWGAGDLDRSVSALREAETSNSQDVEVLDTLAARLDERGNVNESIASAEKAANLTIGKPDNAEKLQKLAQYFERAGQLLNAAYKYNEAARVTTDSRLRSAWETRAKVLFLRIGKNADANVPRPAALRDTQSFIGIPGGLDALRQLTGLTITNEDKSALARVFDACLRNPAFRERLIDFYETFPDLARKVGTAGDVLSGTLTLPSPNQQLNVPEREALKFFGVADKKGTRQIKSGDFESRRFILQALGGDPVKLKNGEPVRITIRGGDLPIAHGFDIWIPLIKDGLKIKPDEKLLAFLKDPQAMKLYVGLSMLPEQAMTDLRSGAFRAKQNDLAEAMYFAAPYLRFDHRGKLWIPGGGTGESNWREALRTNSVMDVMHALLFVKENAGALYLFCALSSAGEIGDAISGSRKSSFEAVFNLFKKSPATLVREPFDFIDFLAHLRLEDDEVRLPRVVEIWQKSADPVKILSQVGRVSAGGQIQLVKQIAVLTQIERERPDWTTNRDVLDKIAALVVAGKESQLEAALDLEMNAEQLLNYLDLVGRIDALPASPEKTSTVRSFQATFELLRYLAKNSSLSQQRIAELTDRALQLNPARNDHALQLVSFLRADVLSVDEKVSGSEVATKLIAALAYTAPIEIPSPSRLESNKAMFLDSSEFAQTRMNKFLGKQKHTPLSSVFDAVTTLEQLDKNPSAADALAKLKASVSEFVEAEPQVDPKKKKPKTPTVPDKTLKEAVAQLGLPIELSTIVGIRERIAPHASEALLAHAYAAAVYPIREESIFLKSELVRNHDFSLPWTATRSGADGKISGNLTRLSQALARIAGTTPAIAVQRSQFMEVTLNSFQAVGPRLVTRQAEEFVARTLDLGEDVLALYKQSDEFAVASFKHLDFLMSQRRGLMVRTLVDRADISRAIPTMTPSELYTLGRIYLDSKLASSSLETLRNEPGSLGVLANIISKYRTTGEKGIPGTLLREVAQFGMSTSSLTGLNRLALVRLEPYEYAVNFREDYRLAERVQDLKLLLARRAHRLGGGGMFPLNIVIADAVLSNTMAQTRRAALGTAPPEYDWESLIAAIQALNEDEFTSLVNQIGASSHVRSVNRGSWNDPRPNGESKP